MALTFAQAQTILQSRIADSSNTTAVAQALNQAQREVARARRWPELMVRAFVNTVAPYSTGTVAIANGATTWTLTGGTFPTDVATGGYRLALSISDPWYTITTRTSGTSVETAAYQDDTETASAFIAYKAHYSLASAVDRVEEMWLHRGGDAVELVSATTDQQVTDFTHYPTGTGAPTHYYMMERDSSGNRQVLLGPDAPDDVYRIEYVYRKKTTDDTFTGNLDETRWPVILARASAILYEPEFYDRHVAAQREYERLLSMEWANESEVETQHVRVGQSRIDVPGWDMGSLMGRGRVQDPT